MSNYLTNFEKIKPCSSLGFIDSNDKKSEKINVDWIEVHDTECFFLMYMCVIKRRANKKIGDEKNLKRKKCYKLKLQNPIIKTP
jgi:hypothetical protein